MSVCDDGRVRWSPQEEADEARIDAWLDPVNDEEDAALLDDSANFDDSEDDTPFEYEREEEDAAADDDDDGWQSMHLLPVELWDEWTRRARRQGIGIWSLPEFCEWELNKLPLRAQRAKRAAARGD